jgi:hypothetical protein
MGLSEVSVGLLAGGRGRVFWGADWTGTVARGGRRGCDGGYVGLAVVREYGGASLEGDVSSCSMYQVRYLAVVAAVSAVLRGSSRTCRGCLMVGRVGLRILESADAAAGTGGGGGLVSHCWLLSSLVAFPIALGSVDSENNWACREARCLPPERARKTT